jgi:hypothetical protein
MVFSLSLNICKLMTVFFKIWPKSLKEFKRKSLICRYWDSNLRLFINQNQKCSILHTSSKSTIQHPNTIFIDSVHLHWGKNIGELTVVKKWNMVVEKNTSYATFVQDISDYAQIFPIKSLKPEKSFDSMIINMSILPSHWQLLRKSTQAGYLAASVLHNWHQWLKSVCKVPCQLWPCAIRSYLLESLRSCRKRQWLRQSTAGGSKDDYWFISILSAGPSPYQQDPALIDPALENADMDIPGGNVNVFRGQQSSECMPCFDGTMLVKRFSCKGQYPFWILSYGSQRGGRTETFLAPSKRAGLRARTLTPFNIVVGGIILR